MDFFYLASKLPIKNDGKIYSSKVWYINIVSSVQIADQEFVDSIQDDRKYFFITLSKEFWNAKKFKIKIIAYLCVINKYNII